MKKSLNLWCIMGIVLTVLSLIAVPLVLTAANKVSVNNGNVMPPYFIEGTAAMIYAIGIPYLYGLIKLKAICSLITGPEYFDKKVSHNFFILANISLLIGAIILIENIIMTNYFGLYFYAIQIIPSFILMFLSVFGYFFLMIVSKIFKQAYNLKKENDLVV